MRYVVIGSLVVVGVVHLLPLSGVLGGERLAALYGLSFNDPNLAILMRHRALLFGLLGSFLIFAAFRPAFQPLAFVAGFASVISFLWLAWFVGGYNEHLGRVVAADIGALVCLGAGAAGYVHLRG
jgi:hypothetical protein